MHKTKEGHEKLNKKMNSSESLIRPGLSASRKKDIPTIKTKLRSKVPQIDYNTVRRTRIPYHEAIIAELYENGLQESAQNMEAIVKHDQSIDIPGFKIMKLCTSIELIDEISDNLSKSEKLYLNKRNDESINRLLKFGNEISEKEHKDLLWLAEDILMIALNKAILYKSDGGRMEGISRFYLAKFFLEKTLSYDKANEHLKIAEELTFNKEWKFDEEKDLQKEVCNYYYKALLQDSNKNRKIDLAKAYELIEQALKVAMGSGNEIGICDCYSLRGEIEKDRKNFLKSLASFREAENFAKMASHVTKICCAQMNIAKCYLQLGNIEESEKQLKILQKYTEKHQMNDFVGQSLMMLGKIALNHGRSVEAANKLVAAIEIFSKFNMSDQLCQARCLAAIAMAKEVMPSMIDTVLKVDKGEFGDNFYLAKLLKWKDRRQPFWIEEDEDDQSITSSIDDLPTYSKLQMKKFYVESLEKQKSSDIYLKAMFDQIEDIKKRSSFNRDFKFDMN